MFTMFTTAAVLVFIVRISFTFKGLGSSSTFHSCLTWTIKGFNLELVCRVSNISYPLYFRDTEGEVVGICTKNEQDCLSFHNYGKLETNVKTSEVIMTIQEIQQNYVNGIWTCMNGKHKFQTEVSTFKGIVSATDIFIRGEVLESSNKIQITCYSCRQPYRNTVEFLVDDESVDSITFNRETDTCVNGIGVIHPDTFTCDLSGTIFVHMFERHNKSPGTHFSCDMRFYDTALSSRFKKKATLYFDGKRFYDNGSILEITKHADPPFIDKNQRDDTNNSLLTTTPMAHDFGISGGRMYLWILVIVLAVIVLGIVPFCYCVYRNSKTIESQLRHRKIDGSNNDELQDTLVLLEEPLDTNAMICLPCEFQFKSTLSTELDLDCTEVYGQLYTCIKDHSSTASDDANNHFDIKKLPKHYVLSFVCSIHELKFECVCVSHDDVCCKSCADEMHSECDVEALPKTADINLFRIAQTIAEYKERISAVLKTSKSIIQSFRCNIQYIINDQRKIQRLLQHLYINTIPGCKSSPNTKKDIDSHKTKSMLKLKDTTKELISSIQRKISEIERVLHTSIEHDELLNFKFENRCEKHSFLLIRYLDSLLTDSERKLETIIERKSTIRLNYEKDPFETLGHIYTIKTYDRVPHSEKTIYMNSKFKLRNLFPPKCNV